MNTPDSIEVVNRFFEAVEVLKRDKIIRGLKTLTKRYGLNDRNVRTQRSEPERNIFQVAWLSYLVRDYAISPEWLLMGEGSVYDPDRKKAFDEAFWNGKKSHHRKKTATAVFNDKVNEL